MSHENMADQSAFLQAACTKSKCIELLALAADYREATAGAGAATAVLCGRKGLF